jgi:hypothetical protein
VSDIELREASPARRAIASSLRDIKVEDAPKPITSHHISGSWIPSRTIHFEEFKSKIPSPRQQLVDKEIDLPDAPGEGQPSNDIDLPDAPGGQCRTEEEQLFYSEGAQLRVSLPATPVDYKPTRARQSFTPTYPPPTSYGSLFAPISGNKPTRPGLVNKSTQTKPDMTSKKIEALEEMLKQMIANDKRDAQNARRDAALAILLARTAPRAATAADDEREPSDTIFQQLGEERIQKLAAVEDELREKYEAAGFNYRRLKEPPTMSGYREKGHEPSYRQSEMENPQPDYNHDAKPEHVKVEQVGLVQPLASHAEWTGQIVDTGNSLLYVSFKGWLDHLEAVLSQKETSQWKKAVLDCATLFCLRGRALD